MTEKLYRIVEIFDSVQGEGPQVGIPMTFVRFAWCNRACVFCDTQFNKPAFTGTARQVAQIIANSKPTWVLFTGGEPLMQLDCHLIGAVRRACGKKVRFALETNGSLWNDVLYDMDFINISPKAHPMDEDIAFHISKRIIDAAKDPAGLVINSVRYSLDKEVIGDPETFEPIDIKAECICFSPLFFPKEELPGGWKVGDGYGALEGDPDEKALKICTLLVQKFKLKNARLSLQQHKIMGVR
jgi:organic radical activating enzyme